MRTGAVIVLAVILSGAANAQERFGGSHDYEGHTTVGPGAEMGPVGGPLGGDLTQEPNVAQPAEPGPIESVPFAGGGGPPAEHSHGGHGHPHCHNDWVCGAGRYEALDNYSVGANVDGIYVSGRWVPGPCWKQRSC